ncbi:MAG: rhodanese-like domain-containing protein [Rickettsiales bacterium]
MFAVFAFYRFTPLADVVGMRSDILAFCRENGVKGTLLLAEEGINATVAGEEGAVADLKRFLCAFPGLEGLTGKTSYASVMPFEKMKVRLKAEIVRMDAGPLCQEDIGDYVPPSAWDAVLGDPNTVVIDTRNEYETRIGRFKGAIAPDTRNFRDFPEWAEQWATSVDREKRVAMYCTGGIRCEKSTAFMRRLGFKNVAHLQGGILQYIEDTANASGAWEGDCFVFDGRAAVDDVLAPTDRVRCELCGEKATADSLKYGKPREIRCESCVSIFT